MFTFPNYIFKEEKKFTIKITFSGDDFQKGIMKVINYYKTKFKIEKKQGYIIIHTYDDLSRKIRMKKSDISDILMLDDNQIHCLKTKQAIKFKNEKTYSDYENVSLTIFGNKVYLRIDYDNCDDYDEDYFYDEPYLEEFKYTFDRKTFISELKKI